MSIVRGSAVNWVLQGPVLISFNQPGVLGDRWQQFLAALQSTQFTHHIGTGLGAIERHVARDASAMLKNKKVVVIIDHVATRRIATVLGWFGMQIKGFDWTHVREAIQYLDAPGFAQDALIQAIYDVRDASVPLAGLEHIDCGPSALRSD